MTRCLKLIAVLFVAVLARAATFDAALDFSSTLNPNGPWSYGSTPTLGGAFALLAAGACGPLTGWQGGGSATGSPPFIYGGVGTCGGGTLTSGFLDLHPGGSGAYADVRFTNSAAGVFAISGIFQGIDPSPTSTDFHVLLNGLSIFDSAINSFHVPTAFNLSRTLIVGDKLDFVVGFGADGSFISDSTGFEATISPTAPGVPEPASGVLILIGCVVAVACPYRLNKSLRAGSL
jgi:hypothetical protein